MQVSFKGFKNAGYFKINYPTDKDIAHTDVFNVQYTDDFNGKDLSQYKDIIAKYPAYKNPINGDFMNVGFRNHDDSTIMILNGNKVDINPQNFDLIAYVIKSLKKLSNIDESQFKVNSSYMDSEDIYNGLLPGIDLRAVLPKNFVDNMLELTHKPSTAKEGATKLFTDLQEMMIRYFD